MIVLKCIIVGFDDDKARKSKCLGMLHKTIVFVFNIAHEAIQVIPNRVVDVGQKPTPNIVHKNKSNKHVWQLRSLRHAATR